MDVKRCDRCGQIYELVAPTLLENAMTNARQMIAHLTSETDPSDYLKSNCDLCAECEEDFRKWFKGGTTNE